MSEDPRPGSPPATTRSTNIVHIGALTWRDVAAGVAPAVARAKAATDGVQAIVLVPSATDAVALSAALGEIHQASGIRVAPLTSAQRGRRIVTATKPHVIVGTIGAVHALVAASALSAEAVAGVAICGAESLEADEAALDQLLAELPRGLPKVLVASGESPFVARVLERHMHGARRVAPAAAEPVSASGPIEVAIVSPSAPFAQLADILDEVDAPSAAIVPADPRLAAAAAVALAALGLEPDAPVARVVEDGATDGAALLIIAGVPAAAALKAAFTTPPARVIALVTARERAALAELVPDATLQPWLASATRAQAVDQERQLRDRIRQTLATGLPAREMLALEPLLADHDALAIAGALLRMTGRASMTAAPAMRPAPPAASAPRAPSPRTRTEDPERPRSGDDRERPSHRGDRGDRESRGPREGRERKSFGDRKPFGDRKSFGDRKPYGERKSFGDREKKPYGDRDKKPYGRRDGKPFGDRDRKPYPPRDRGGRPPRREER